ncbi:hypothetical protein SeMB42_g00357 [Synchytrium endobioticum]|uniref:Uncharacterized protein n=1 Tax=Synchytrium endobioticum TaxID=286115 RepID=A0A507DSP7_9FUNG|nr:hypothetical protein SeLEV6574_g00924 [Synchytrium endobioticum]TPX54282.1 hypothetical protein SeMB42_g00357 [Synchytrium endobioticum]
MAKTSTRQPREAASKHQITLREPQLNHNLGRRPASPAMSNAVVPATYRWVIDHVITQITAQSAELGLEDQTLTEMQAMWERKLVETRSANYGPPHFDALVPTHPRVSANLPPQNLLSQHLHYRGSISQYDGAYDDVPSARAVPDDSALNARTSSTRDRVVDPRATSAPAKPDAAILPLFSITTLLPPRIPQYDGDRDDKTKVKQDDEIGSDLDDDDDNEEEEVGLDNTILSLYDKVSRVKNKWKCSFKDGVVMVNGKDYLYSKANGDFEW